MANVRLIDAELFKHDFNKEHSAGATCTVAEVIESIDMAATVDAVLVTRCKDCESCGHEAPRPARELEGIPQAVLDLWPYDTFCEETKLPVRPDGFCDKAKPRK